MAVQDGTILKCVADMVMPSDVVHQNVFYLKLNTAAPWADAALVIEVGDYVDAVYANILDDIDNDCTLGDVIVNEWDWNAIEDQWETGRYVGLSALVGVPAGVGDMLPHAVAATTTGYSEDVGARSRKSYSGFTDDKQQESNWVAGAIVDLVAAAADWISLYALGGVDSLEPVIPTKTGLALSLIASLVSTIIGSQRQRKPGEGV